MFSEDKHHHHHYRRSGAPPPETEDVVARAAAAAASALERKSTKKEALRVLPLLSGPDFQHQFSSSTGQKSLRKRRGQGGGPIKVEDGSTSSITYTSFKQKRRFFYIFLEFAKTKCAEKYSGQGEAGHNSLRMMNDREATGGLRSATPIVLTPPTPQVDVMEG